MIRSLKHYFEKKNEFYTENLEPSYTNWNILKCKDLYLSKVSDLQREQSSQLLTEKTIFHAFDEKNYVKYINMDIVRLLKMVCTNRK